MSGWSGRTIFRHDNERDWRLQQEYRARIRREQAECLEDLKAEMECDDRAQILHEKGVDLSL